MFAARAAIKINEKIHEQCKSLYEKLPLSGQSVLIIVGGNIRPLFFYKGIHVAVVKNSNEIYMSIFGYNCTLCIF